MLSAIIHPYIVTSVLLPPGQFQHAYKSNLFICLKLSSFTLGISCFILNSFKFILNFESQHFNLGPPATCLPPQVLLIDY
jgi:hypothetical protein